MGTLRTKTMSKAFLIVFLSLFLIFSFASASNNGGKERVIAHTADEVNAALAQGCTIVRETKGITALLCPDVVASLLGLPEDIKVFTMDAGANTQIKANLVHPVNTGAGRKVVVLDTGYNYNHPELISSYLGGKDFVNSDNDPMDDNGHGSHVSGIITADGVLTSAKGVSPDAGIISGKVLSSSGSGYFSDIIAAIYWAVDGNDGIYGTADDFNADAISMSLGTSQPYTYKGFCDGVYPALTNAIKYAKERNVVVVSAAGNSGGAGVSLPGCISYSTTVGAVDSFDKIASFSGKGNAVDITAPGVNILSSWLGNSYVYASGTSMATPMVSGVIALLKAKNSSLTSAQVENALFTTAKDLGKKGKDVNYGWGRVDAYAAVNFV